jgi:Kef-type K+ transport system membrane component KefB
LTSPGTLASILLWVSALLLFALAGGWLAERARQPAVLGELIAGVAAGALFTIDRRVEPALDLLSSLGVIFLLFEVGLETSLAELKAVGVRAALVALVGVAVPVALGALVTRAIDPDALTLTSLFIGATLAATSVGITARVLRDQGRQDSLEARVVLGAAVVDDVLGLLLLSFLVAGARGVGSMRDTALLGVQAVTFLALSVFALPPLLRRLPREPGPVSGIVLCLLMGWGADRVGLAPIVGAFAAGIAISSARKSGPASDPAAARPWDETSHDPIPLRAAVRGLAAVLAPLFFIEMGRRVDLRAAVSGSAPLLLAALIAAAVLGKIVAGLAAPRGTRLAVGLGMIPRGEVGLIFAGLGRSLGLVDEATTSTLVLVVLATTLIGPPALRWRLSA